MFFTSSSRLAHEHLNESKVLPDVLLQIQGSEIRGTRFRQLEENMESIGNCNKALYSSKGTASLIGRRRFYIHRLNNSGTPPSYRTPRKLTGHIVT